MPRSSPPTVPQNYALVVGHTLYQSFRRFSPTEAWSPAINVYQAPDRLEVAVDLAGIDREQIDVRMEPGRLSIRGVRQAPEPPRREGEAPMRIVAMEIDYGPFSRTLQIPENVDLPRTTSQYRDGILWITLPLRRR